MSFSFRAVVSEKGVNPGMHLGVISSHHFLAGYMVKDDDPKL